MFKQIDQFLFGRYKISKNYLLHNNYVKYDGRNLAKHY